jgi:hypothetical protein
VNHRLGYQAVVDALTAAGLDVATGAAELAPPTVYLLPYQTHPEDAATLAGAFPLTVAVHYVGIRGPQDSYVELDAVEAVEDALLGLDCLVGLVGMARTSVTVNEATTWPCLRWEATVQT